MGSLVGARSLDLVGIINLHGLDSLIRSIHDFLRNLDLDSEDSETYSG